MPSIFRKRTLLLFLCLILVLALVPAVALATGEQSAHVAQIQTRIDTLLTDYLGATNLTEDEIIEIVEGMDWETYQTARWEISLLEEDVLSYYENGQITEAELQALINRNAVFCVFSEVLEDRAANDHSVNLLTPHSILNGAVTVSDSANSSSVSGGTVTITAKGSLFSKKTNNITITNNSGGQAKLYFEYTVTNANSFTIAGVNASASGNYNGMLDANGTLAIVLTSNSGLSNTTATLKLSNFSLTAAAASSSVTFNYDSALGSITAGGATVNNGDVIDVSGTDGVALVATPKSGNTFLGWIDTADNSVLSTAASYTLKPAEDMTVKAAFAGNGGTPWFGVGAKTQKSESVGLLGMSKLYYYTVSTNYLFDNLNDAATFAAASASNKAIVLMNSGTLPAGDYTIPAGVALLIPFDANNTLYTTDAVGEQMADTVKTPAPPTAYRTLTMADGANLKVNGALSLSAKHWYAQGSKASGGSPSNNVSFISMQGKSNITVNNGGTLYAYGFITGSGSVVANSGASVYEYFQIMDFRGGTQSTDMENGVFPLSQYYVQNIEVPLTLHSGAKEYAYTTIYMSSADFHTSVNFIGPSDSMFNLTSGSVTKSYDGTTDRISIEVNGNMAISNVDLDFGTSSINSKNYELAIANHISVAVKKGSNISVSQDIALLPGAEITIDQEATVTLDSNINIYVYDLDEWGNYTFGADSVNSPVKPVGYAPGRTYDRTAADLKDALIDINGYMDASEGYVYTTVSGANIISSEGTGVIKTTAGTQTTTYQLVQGTGYTEIPITPAKLKNADGSFTETSGANTPTTYSYRDGFWCTGENDHDIQTHQCTCCNYVKKFSIYGTSVRIGDGMDLFFYIAKGDLEEGASYYVEISQDGKIEKQYISSDKWSDYTAEYRRFSYDGIAAKEMGDDVTVTIYLGNPNDDVDDVAVSYPCTESVAKYAYRFLGRLENSSVQTELALRTVLVDMLNYGAAAQVEFTYNTSNLVNENLTNDQRKWASTLTAEEYWGTKEVSNPAGIKATLTLESTLVMTFYVYDGNYHDYEATITYTDHYGKEVNQTLTFNATSDGSSCYAELKNVSIADGRCPITCVITKSGAPYATIASYSVARYLYTSNANTNGTKEIYPMLMQFIDSSITYFELISKQQ